MLETWQVTLIASGASLFGALVGAAIAFVTNAQRLRAENRRVWNDKIASRAVAIDRLSVAMQRTFLQPAFGADEVATEMKEQVNLLDAEIAELQFIAPESINHAAVRMHLSAMALMAFQGIGSDKDKIAEASERFSVSRQEFRSEVKKRLGVTDGPRQRYRWRKFKRWISSNLPWKKKNTQITETGH